MNHEKSYGAVIYTLKDDQLLFLVEDMVLGHVSLPKGHIEEGETPLLCALREIKEETNLDVEIDIKTFSHTITYSPKPDTTKDVTFFLARPISDDPIPQIDEVKSIRWLTPEEAIEAVTYETDRETLKLAAPIIRNLLHAQK